MRYILLLILLAHGAFAQRVINPKFQAEINRLTRSMGIEKINTTDLMQFSKATNFDKHFQILDTRKPEEYNVSHLQGAIHANYADFDYDKISSKLAMDKTIVIYCSVGYRSGKIAQILKRLGHSVLNLNGGIFEWSNNKYPLYNSKQKITKKVHTYNSDWAKWVEFGEKVH